MLGKALIDSFHENGFLILKSFFTAQQIEQYKEYFDHKFCSDASKSNWVNDEGIRKQMIPFLSTEDSVYSDLESNIDLNEAVESLLGKDFHSMPSEGIKHSMGTKWHYDGMAPKSESHKHLKAILFLDPVSFGTGAISVLKGSQNSEHWRSFDSNPEKYTHLDDSSENVQTLTAIPGDLVLLDVKTLHAVFANNAMRRVIYLNYVNASYYEASCAQVTVEDKMSHIKELRHEIEDMVIRGTITQVPTQNTNKYLALSAH